MHQLFIYEEQQGRTPQFYVTDMAGNVQFVITGKTNRIKDIVQIYTTTGRLLFVAKQRVLSPFSTFDLYDTQEKIGTLKKHPGLFSWRRPYYKVTPVNWKITGDFKAERYEMRTADKKWLLDVQKALTARGRQFILVMNDPEHAAFYSLLAVLIEHFARSSASESQFKRRQNYDFGFLNFERWRN